MSEASTLEGTRLGAYRIERQLGEGAMGEVFLAVHEALGRQVAIKKLKPQVAADRAMTERFFAEARAVNIIRHENIVECTDLVNEGGTSYIVMELLEGKTLSVAIRQAKQMPAVRAAKIAAQIADALAAAHTKGIVHRDLKPDNVFLIKRAGSADYVKVLDFGMARLRPELGGVGATQSGALIGTPAYMAPEQARGEKVGPAADIYALGVVLFHMLTGQLPFAAESLTMMLIQIVQEMPPRIDKLAKDVPPALVALVARCLDKDASKRPPDMATLRRELFEAVGLPVETAQSVAASQSPLASGNASIALTETMESGPRPDVNPLAETSAPGLGATTAPMWSGQSSLTAAAAEVSTAPKRRPRWPMIAAAGGALAIVVGVGVVVTNKHTPESKSSAPAARPADPPQTAAPAPSAPTPPVAAPVVEPAGAGSAVGSASAIAAVPTETTVPKKTPKKTTAKIATTPKAGSGAGSAVPDITKPPVETKSPEEKIDRTKQLVGPKPGS
ncbi:MAG TPA: serine/threonine-protein kinase [Kofleriaceae bacterium]|nr:serine/threonine-protein kinase [Kofleriaceae bacterium]